MNNYSNEAHINYRSLNIRIWSLFIYLYLFDYLNTYNNGKSIYK